MHNNSFSLKTESLLIDHIKNADRMYLRKQYIKYILLQNENYFIEIIHLPMTLSLYEHEYSYKEKNKKMNKFKQLFLWRVEQYRWVKMDLKEVW